MMITYLNWYLDKITIIQPNDPITKDITVYAGTEASPAEWFVVDNGVLVQCTPPDIPRW